MLVNINQSEMADAFITPTFYIDKKETQILKMRAPNNFVENTMIPILTALASNLTLDFYVYSYFQTNTAVPGEALPVNLNWVYLRKSKAYEKVFDIFKTYGINLTGLWLAYNPDKDTLYVPKKVYQLISKFDEKAQSAYVLNLLYCYRFLRALTLTKNDCDEYTVIGAPNLTFNIGSKTIDSIITKTELNSTVNSVSVDVISDDYAFYSLRYIQTAKGAQLPLSLSAPSIPTTGMVYNVLKSNGHRCLAIVNKNFKPAAYYIINMLGNTMYTNMELQNYNTLSDGSEFIPNIARCCIKNTTDVDNWHFTVRHKTLSTLLDDVFGSDTFEIDSDTDGFEAILDEMPTVTENYDMKLYDNAHSDKLKLTSSGIEGNVASQYVDDAYAQMLYQQNQPYYDTYDLGNLTPITKGIVAKDDSQIYSMLFEGETGTGKSTAARVMFAKVGLPWVSINCSTNIDEADIFGSMIPNPTKKDASDPEFVWQDGPATRAIRHGYGLIVEEGNGARPGILLKFNSLLDEARQIELGNGEILKAHPNFRIVFTSNIAYEGTNLLNKAFIDRFNIVHKFEDVDKPTAIAIVKNRTGYTNATKIEQIYGVYLAIKKYSHEQNLGLAISIRRLMDVFTKGKYYKNAGLAVKDILLDHAFLQEPEHLEYFTDTILPSFDLTFKI